MKYSFVRTLSLLSICLLIYVHGMAQHAIATPKAGYVKNKAQAADMSTITDMGNGDFYLWHYTADYKPDRFIKAGITSHQQLIKQVVLKLMKPGKALTHIKDLKLGCSAFQATTPEGDIIYARNFDFPFTQSVSMMVCSTPANGYKSVSMVPLSFLGYKPNEITQGEKDISTLVSVPYLIMDGMNEKGLAISVLQVDGEGAAQRQKGKPSIMTTMAMRYIMDHAANVYEAIDIMKEYNFWADGTQKKQDTANSYHFLLSDARGNTAILEYIKKDNQWIMNVVKEKIVTNSYRSPGWQHIGHGMDRYNTLTELYKYRNGIFTEDEAMRGLQAVAQYNAGLHHSYTLWSVVYNLTKGTAFVCINGDYKQYYHIDITDF